MYCTSEQIKLVCLYHVYNLEEAEEVGAKAVSSRNYQKSQEKRDRNTRKKNINNNDNDNNIKK